MVQRKADVEPGIVTAPRLNQGLQGASGEAVREWNRRLLLNLIRRRQPVSRAELARLSGLQRSTVSLIVEELVSQRWVVEASTGRLPRGRRPTFLRLNDKRAAMVVDIRPTRITVALADIHGRFLSQELLPTPREPDAAIEELCRRLRRLLDSHPDMTIEGVAISLPGRFDPLSGRLVFAPNLKWPPCDLRAPIEQMTGLQVWLENAANACALAEAWYGEHRGVRDLVVVTVSEGIGTGLLLNGELVTGQNHMAGEFGHVALEPDGPLCGCGRRGCWETLASNRAALRYYGEGAPEQGPSFQDLLALCEQGDPLAVRAIDRMAAYLGRGLRMIVAGLAPEVIVIVGELTRCWQRFEPVLKAEIAAQTLAGPAPRLAPAQDGATARLRGAVALIFQKYFGPPLPA
jgi:predicted NBD/HSP70 family sugar kinase